MRMRVSNTLRQTIVRTRVVASFSAPVFYEQSTAILHIDPGHSTNVKYSGRLLVEHRSAEGSYNTCSHYSLS